ncbi:hypothetical protein J7L67_07950 [bacterium]|nr:hypothetical protein [bacterium]
MDGSVFSRINSLIPSQYLLNTLNNIQEQLLKQQTIASTFKKINKASDGPAAYFMIRQLDRKISNSSTKDSVYENSINLLQRNDSYLSQISSILTEMSELANDALGIDVTTAEKIALQENINQLRDSVTDILSSGVDSKIYTGFSVGSLQNASLSGTGGQPTLSSLTLNGLNLNVTGSTSDINQTITNIDNAATVIEHDEGRLGSYIKRIGLQQDMNAIEQVNYMSTRSVLQDADIVETQMEITRLSLLQSTTLALAAQANIYYTRVLSLLA